MHYQDATISQEELDWLVHVRVWGEDRYELANFTDDELVPALTELARRQGRPAVDSHDWQDKLKDELRAARVAHQDIKVAMGRSGVREAKPELARLLWPTLRAKCELELANGTSETPVLDLVLEVRRLVTKLSGVMSLHGR